MEKLFIEDDLLKNFKESLNYLPEKHTSKRLHLLFLLYQGMYNDKLDILNKFNRLINALVRLQIYMSFLGLMAQNLRKKVHMLGPLN